MNEVYTKICDSLREKQEGGREEERSDLLKRFVNEIRGGPLRRGMSELLPFIWNKGYTEKDLAAKLLKMGICGTETEALEFIPDLVSATFPYEDGSGKDLFIVTTQESPARGDLSRKTHYRMGRVVNFWEQSGY